MYGHLAILYIECNCLVVKKLMNCHPICQTFCQFLNVAVVANALNFEY